MPLLAPIFTQLMIRLTQIALLLFAALAFSGANALPVSSERQSSISALGYALAPLIRNGDRPAIEKAISA
ncbi:hypothetical protein, partial [Pontibacterium sp.]|uniref:hypothetical protein n=1 Tax=Pontibacterium sp. TaxID=2036026 RepID=UPI0035154E93